jgi:hypothetical protein
MVNSGQASRNRAFNCARSWLVSAMMAVAFD